MNKRISVLSALAALALVACGSQPEKVAVTEQSPDSEKMPYLFGMELGSQLFKTVPRQIGEGLSEDAVVQGLSDAFKRSKDSTFALQLSESTLQKIGDAFSGVSKQRMEQIQPDSATRAALKPAELKARNDSLIALLEVKPEPAVTGKSVKLNDSTSSNIEKFSYIFGVNFEYQFKALNTQAGIEFSEDAFILGIRDGHKAAKDTSFRGVLSKDTVAAVNKRFVDRVKQYREEQKAKAKLEQEKLRQEIAPLRGDTLPDGLPAKFNLTVPLEGITGEGSNLSAYAEKPLLVFYFSSTCGHCRHSAPEIEKLAETYKDKGLTTVGVASGGNNKKGIRQFIEDTKATYPVYFDAERKFGELYSDGYVPKVYLVSPDGSYKIYKSFNKEEDSVKVDIEALLKKK